jgi:hypothetical protein
MQRPLVVLMTGRSVSTQSFTNIDLRSHNMDESKCTWSCAFGAIDVNGRRYTPESEHDDVQMASGYVYRQLFEQRKALVPSRATFNGAVMVADITGFTKLTEILSKRGSTGVELLTNCINHYFGKVSSCRSWSCCRDLCCTKFMLLALVC